MTPPWRTLAAAAAVLLLVVLAGCSSPTGAGGGASAPSTSRTSASTATDGGTCSGLAAFFGVCQCPDHWHATFAAFVPETGSPAGDQADPLAGVAHRIDWASPRTASGVPFYDLGRDPEMTVSIHMHQGGPEAGSAALGRAQIHFEAKGDCHGLLDVLDVLDLQLDGDGLSLEPGSALATSEPVDAWTSDGASSRLRFYLEVAGEDGQWQWEERSLDESQLNRQLRDGEAFLLVFGDFTEAQVTAMQDQVPPPISRPRST